ncbi:MAG TPA: ABC transporter permease [Cyclobacteriaceae bacterium]|nr:ABC transporter permease [Cyclobacteriaceae bacterium]
MFRNLLLTAYRSIKKNKFFSFLNIIGLGIGMAVFLLIALYVRFERSYENFVGNAENIYRVTLTTYVNNELVITSAENYPGVGPAFKSELPEVESFARLYNMGYKNNVIITREDAKPDPIAFKHRKFLYADSSFLPMMQYELIKGDAKTALADPLTAVISEKYATMYFGEEDPIGKMLRLQDDDFNNELVKVTGVFRDLPANTHLKFDILFSYETLYGRGDWAPNRYNLSWGRKDMYTFIQVRPGTDIQALEAKFPQIVAKYNPALKERNQKDVLALQPLASIHLASNLAEEAEPNGDSRIVQFMALIGIFVLVIAWINYVNLSTAKAMERAREVGVRKVMGAFKSQLVRQFLMESAMINLVSILIALAIAILVLPYFNALSGLSLTIFSFLEPWFLILLSGLWLVGTLLSGFYPALVLSSFKPVSVLKGKLKNSLSGILMRKGLVTLQFIASVVMIAATLIVYRQLNFMMSRDLGMDIDQVLVVERPGIAPRDRQAFNSTVDVFRNEVKKDPSVVGFTTSVTIPGKQREYKAVAKRYGAPDDEQVTLRFNSMDYDYINVFKMHLLAGRAFSEEFTNDPDTSVIISESSAKLLGYKNVEEAVGQTIAIPGFEWNPIVVGVVNDYHQVSLKKPLDPSIFYCTAHGGEFYSIRVKTSDLTATVEQVRLAWEKAFPGNPFDYFFLDDYFNKQYENERRFGKLFSTFAGLAVIVGCLGLFGLSAYTASQRTKEIGIRKVLGSSEQGIFMLLSKEYVNLVLIAIAIAVPLVWLGMNNWITSFPYRTTISITVFVIAGLAVLLVAISTVSFQTMKAARINPVESLRHE